MAISCNSGALVLLLAGGQGERLYPLTKNRAKPVVPFGGLYRIIDFTLSNCINSGLKRIYVLTQHKSLSLDRHIRVAWNVLHPEMGEFIQTVPPQLQLVSRWYSGTADAVFHNLHLLEEERPEHILILSGDHVYRLDYELLLQFHLEHDADLTIASTEVPRIDAGRFGVLEINEQDRVVGFEEKPARPRSIPQDDNRSLVNMGVYLFKTEPLVRAVIADAKESDSAHDFGKNVIPAMVDGANVFAFNIVRSCPPMFHYWQDIGTIDSYFLANMELLLPNPPFDLFDHEWGVRTHLGQHPPALMRDAGGLEARAVNSIVSPGCVISGGSVLRSVLSPDVSIGTAAVVEECILMNGVEVKGRAYIRRAIIDENVVIPQDTQIGADIDQDRKLFQVTEQGIVLVPEGTILPALAS